jgi:predicted DNA-binding protein
MSKQPFTPNRTFRLPDSTYTELKAFAAARGLSVSDVVRAAIEKFLEDSLWDEDT